MNTIEVKVPDIGDFADVPVIEVFVKPGDSVKAEDPLITLESDKATMDVPAPSAGTVRALQVKVGDRVSEGTSIVTLEAAGDGAGAEAAAPSQERAAGRPSQAPATQSVGSRASPTPPVEANAASDRAPRGEKGHADAPGEGATTTPPAGTTYEVRVPDIGDFKDVPVIEVLVKPGDIVKVDDPLVTLESDKATMDVPSPIAGTVQGVRVAVGAKVSEGTVIATLAPSDALAAAPPADTQAPSQPNESGSPGIAPHRTAEPAAQPSAAPRAAAPSAAPVSQPSPRVDEAAFRVAHASPSVRKFARELGVDLAQVKGSGPKGRILQQDVQAFVKQSLARPAPVSPAAAPGAGGLNVLPWPQVDFTKFGPIETKPLSRIKKISGANLARNWVMIPHVTQFEDADISDLEALRVTLNKEYEKAGVKLTMLAFLIKACVAALRKFPDFNASLVSTPDGENLVYKQYFNIGFAADTPNGLVVPVIKNADQKGVIDIAKETSALAAKAREGKLGPADMQGGCFSISSLGGIGGTAFTPIINAPEVAILGVSKSTHKPVWDGKQFAPRLILPMSLSYDHRVIDGALAARFTSFLGQLLADMRRVIL